MKLISNTTELLEDVSETVEGFLRYAIENPNKPIPVYPESDTVVEAEQEARRMVTELRTLQLNEVFTSPVFTICHAERDRIWCEFTLSASFERFLQRDGK